MNIIKRLVISLSTAAILLVVCTAAVYADTNGSEIQVTSQPDKLILQLGPQWAGVEFELKTDAGVFPVPVVVDSAGILKMDLGGSKTYTLSCLNSAVSVPATENPAETQAPIQPPATSAGSSEAPEPGREKEGVPAGVLAMFLFCLAAALGALLAMRYFKRRRESYTDDDEDNYDE